MARAPDEPAPPRALDDAAELRERVADGTLVAMVDFDGTLAEIVDRPEDAAIREDARDALRRLAAAPETHVAAVSGRALADLRERVGLDDVAYAGNHGLEIEAGDRRRVHPTARDARDALSGAIEEVAAVVDGIDGARIEDKELTATVHFRQVEDPEDERAVRESVELAVGARDSLAVHEAKQAREVRPDVDWHKGRAVEWLVDALADGRGTALYVGDDVTDEDAFRAVGERGVSVKVGEGETAAEWRVPDPAAVAELLAWLAALRERTA